MKHFLFYIPSFAGGGAERVAAMLANQFCCDGHRVTFVVNSEDGPHRSLLMDQITLHALQPRSHFTSIFLFAGILRTTNPDGIFCRGGLCALVGVLGSVLAGKCRRTIIAFDSLYSPTAQLGTRLTRYSSFAITRLSRWTVCVSTDILTELHEKFWAARAKLKVIYNPVEFEEIGRKSRAPLPDALLALLADRPFLVAVGRFVMQKDYPTLIKAFHHIHQQIPHDLVILGEGPLEEEIRTLVNTLGLDHRVHFPGFLQNPFPVFRAASLFVLSSQLEGFGNVLIEAMTVGTPVVSTNCPGGPKEILENGKYGPLVPVGDDRVLGDALLATLQDPLPREVLIRRAQVFSLDAIASQYLEECPLEN